MSNQRKGYFKSKKEEINRHIEDIKVDFKVLTRIHQTIKSEKRKPRYKAGFYKKDIQGKKEEILEMLKDEEEFLSSLDNQEDEKSGPSPSFTSNFEGRELYELLLKPMMERHTGMLIVSGSSNQAELWYENGSLFHARLGSKIGERAFFETVQIPDGRGEFFPQDILDEERSISGEVSIFLKRSLMLGKERKGYR